MQAEQKKRILYIFPGLVPPYRDPARDRFSYLSKIAAGDILLPVWFKSAEDAPEFLRAEFPQYRVGEFCYHLLPIYKYPKMLRRYAQALFYLRMGWQLHRERKIEAIIAYGTNTPGLSGVILKWITGAQFVVEIPGMPENIYRFDEPNPGISASIKHQLANVLLLLVCWLSDCIRLLYPTQLENYPLLRNKKAAVFHDFVPIGAVPKGAGDEPYVLLLGHPWYTKGVDTLIRAFRLIASAHHNWKLKLMGHYPEQKQLERLAGDCKQIEFVPAAPNEIALKVMAGCSVFALASRTEGLARVLLEAMAAGKPIVAFAVGGTSHCITHNENGILVEPGNVAALAAGLDRVMNSPELAKRLGAKARTRVFSDFDEHAYTRAFDAMLRSLEQGTLRSVQEQEQESAKSWHLGHTSAGRG